MIPGVSTPAMPGPAVDFGQTQGSGVTAHPFRALYCVTAGTVIIKNINGDAVPFPCTVGQTLAVGGIALESGTTGTYNPLY